MQRRIDKGIRRKEKVVRYLENPLLCHLLHQPRDLTHVGSPPGKRRNRWNMREHQGVKEKRMEQGGLLMEGSISGARAGPALVIRKMCVIPGITSPVSGSPLTIWVGPLPGRKREEREAMAHAPGDTLLKANHLRATLL